MSEQFFTISMATEQDAADILAIYAPYVQTGTESWEYDPPAIEEYAQRIAQVRAAGLPWLVAREGRRLLGYAYAGRYGARRGYDFTVEVSIYMDPQEHGRGIGRALYTALLALLKAQGYCNAMAIITDPNPGSDAFHEAMGFACIGRFPHMGYKHKKWLGLSYYRAILGEFDEKTAPPLALQQLDSAVVSRILRG